MAKRDNFSMRSVTGSVYRCETELTQVIMPTIIWERIIGTMKLADRLIESGMDEEQVFIQLINEINDMAFDFYYSDDSLNRFLGIVEDRACKIGHFMCFIDPYMEREHYIYVALRIEQDGSEALIFPECDEQEEPSKNTSKIIRDGKLVTGRYKFNENAEQL